MLEKDIIDYADGVREVYEKTKYKKFVASCKLEGIHLEDNPKERTMSEILDKYRNHGKRDVCE